MKSSALWCIILLSDSISVGGERENGYRQNIGYMCRKDYKQC